MQSKCTQYNDNNMWHASYTQCKKFGHNWVRALINVSRAVIVFLFCIYTCNKKEFNMVVNVNYIVYLTYT